MAKTAKKMTTKEIAKTKKASVKKATKKVAKKKAAPAQLTLPHTEPDPIATSTMKPGYLIGFKTSVTGQNVQYDKEVIEEEHRLRTGEMRASWTTQRTILDPEEHKRAQQVRMRVWQIIGSVCARSKFGMLCPKNKLDQLRLATAEANRIVSHFNRTAEHSFVEFNIFRGEIARNDVEAARAIRAEVRGLITEMHNGIRTGKVEDIRKAATKSRQIEPMLEALGAETLKSAVTAGRKAARAIAKAADGAAVEVDRAILRELQAARTAFLDVDEETPETAPIPEARGARDVDADEDASSVAEEPETPTGEARNRASKDEKEETKVVARYRGGGTEARV